jgi:hypothetical protein
MDETTRRIVWDACALADQAAADFQHWEVRRERDTGLVHKTMDEQPPPAAVEQMLAEQQQQWNDWAKAHVAVAREETNILAKEAGAMIGKLQRRVRELELQTGYEQRLRELEAKINKLSADMDADHAPSAAPLIPLRGGRGNAA